MLLDSEITFIVKSSRTISNLSKIGIVSKLKDSITLPITQLWTGASFKVNVKCDICDTTKLLSYCGYISNYTKYNLYCCSNKCAYVKNKLTNIEKYGDENFRNPDKHKLTKLEKYGDENFNNRDKYKQTNLEKYNDENFNNREKCKQTNLERYGVTCSLLSESVKEKIKITNIKKYGIEDSRSAPQTIEKRKQTHLERYGVEYHSQTQDHWDSVKITSIIKYNETSPNKSDIVKQNKIKSMLKKYGCISPSMLDEYKEKRTKTHLERYGVEYPMQVPEFAEKQMKNAFMIHKYNDSLMYQGSYEKHFLDYMSKRNLIDNVSRGMPIKYNFENKNKTYLPDFYIEKYNLIVEIKSSYFYNKEFDKNIAKMNKCVELGYNYLFVINKQYSVLDSILDKNIRF